MSTYTPPATTVAIVKAIDAYLMTQRAAAETVGKHWLFIDVTDKRKIEDDYQDPIDAGMAAFLASLARSGYALIPAEGNDLYVLLDGMQV